MSVVNAIPMLLGGDGYQISRSVRLRSSASAYFSRTPAGYGASTQTMSFWFKRGNVSGSAVNPIRSSYYDANNYSVIAFDVSAGKLTILQVENGTTVCNKATDAVYRDPSAWYHVVINTDLSRSSGDKNRIYVNGVLQSCTGTDNQVYQLWPYTAYTQVIGYAWASGTYLDGYLTEVNFIDGQALTPSSFGETDSITGVWKPKKYTGTYGTNGFFLNFSDNSSNTATTIGKDYSGNGNNWTPNNISVTAGVTYDSMLDVPTMWADGGSGRGNYCTLNPLNKNASSITVLDGNLGISTSASNVGVSGTIGVSSGKWYWETTFTNASGVPSIGAATAAWDKSYAGYIGSVGYHGNGVIYNNGTNVQSGLASYTSGDVIGVALDLDAGSIKFYKNNTQQGTTITGLTGEWFPAVAGQTSSTLAVNFGQRPFAYTPPTGFKALNTQNLPDATIKKGNAYFDVSTWSGNASTQSVVNSGLMQPDLVWAKARGGTAGGAGHIWQDAVRGLPYYLQSNTTGAEGSAADHITSFNSNGFSMGAGGSINAASTTYVGWQWKESVSAGFDIVTYTGTGSATTIAHSLGVAPKMMIVKSRSSAGRNWIVYHTSLGATQGIQLNLTGAASTVAGFWNNTAPTSSVFTVGGSPSSGYDDVNLSAATYVAYLFAEVAGFSKFGSYTGNGSTDGPFVYTGFRPKFVMVKCSSTTGNWRILDTSRDTYNGAVLELYPNSSAAEGTATPADMDVLSNGFKLRTSGDPNSAQTFIFAAFAENPFKNSLAR